MIASFYGYMTQGKTNKKWNLGYKIPALGSISGFAIMFKEENLSYDSEDCEIVCFWGK